jgi:ferrochelatase
MPAPAFMTKPSPKTGVLLIQLGTPEAPRTPEVRRYLEEFLNDPYVIDSHPLVRWMLLNLIILPRRPKHSAAAYAQVWEEAGSPLMIHSLALRDRLRERTPTRHVALGMRYGKPSTKSALAELVDAGCERIVAIPLYPQEAWSSTRTAVEKAREELAAISSEVELLFVPAFFDDEGFLEASAAVARPVLDTFSAEHYLFSFHGLPARHIRKADPSGTWCLQKPHCCDEINDQNRRCYRAQCAHTARELAARLEIPAEAWTMGFQSRLTRGWIEPFSDHLLVELAQKGVKRLVVFCPAFVADCLETLEEIAIRAREEFIAAGGDDLRLVPSLNASSRWVEAVDNLVTLRQEGKLGDIDYSHFKS